MPERFVLVVDDETEIREIIRASCETVGLIVCQAESGNTAINLLKAHHFDAVISDIRMPDGDGVVLSQWIREHQPDLPIIVMTGYAEESIIDTLRKIRVEGFYRKPFNLKIMTDFIVKCVDLREKMQYVMDRIKDAEAQNDVHELRMSKIALEKLYEEAEHMRMVY